MRESMDYVLTSPRPDEERAGRPLAPLAVAALIAVWLFAFKVTSFNGLGDSLDIFLQTQISRSWLEGSAFAENFHGYHLGVHTYFLLLLFGPLTKLFGSYSLLFILALAWGAAFYLAQRILCLLGLPALAAGLCAFLLVCSPLSLHVFHDWQYGFHVELLEPPLALFLLYALLRQSWSRTIISLALFLAVKEDTPQLAAAICLVVLIENFTRTRTRSTRRWHRHAFAGIAISVAALPILVAIIAVNPHPPDAWGGLERLQVAYADGVRSYPELAAYIASHISDWALSPSNRAGVGAMVLASYGTVLLRPHYLPLAMLFTMVSWLMGDDPLWASRLSPMLAFTWVVTLFSLASLGRTWRVLDARIVSSAKKTLRYIGAAAAAVVVYAMCAASFPIISRPYDVYTMSPWTYYTEDERQDADELFFRYRVESTPDEPVIAHIYLFRYAHDRNLYWFYRMRPNITPEWILWDDNHPHFETWGFPTAEYRQLAKKGRFSLWKSRESGIR